MPVKEMFVHECPEVMAMSLQIGEVYVTPSSFRIFMRRKGCVGKKWDRYINQVVKYMLAFRG